MSIKALFSGYHRCRARLTWERRWRSKNPRSPWLRGTPRDFVTTGFEAGWLSPGMTVLEIGCGLGHTSAWLASHGLNIVAIDFSEHVISRARRLFPEEPGLVFKAIDVCGDNPLTTTFDVLIDTGCLQGLPDALHGRYKRNLLLWSRSGSRFVVPMHTLKASFHERLAQVQSLLCPPFEVVHVEESPSSAGGPPKPVIHLVRHSQQGA